MGAKVNVVNHTTRPLKLKVGNQLVFTDLVTVEQEAEYKMSVRCSEAFREYLFGVDTRGCLLLLSAHECQDKRSIVIKEVDGTFLVQMELRESNGRSWRRGISFWKFWNYSILSL